MKQQAVSCYPTGARVEEQAVVKAQLEEEEHLGNATSNTCLATCETEVAAGYRSTNRIRFTCFLNNYVGRRRDEVPSENQV